MLQIYFIAFLLFGPICTLGENIGHVTRDYFGDIFSLEDCDPGSCERNGRRAAEIPGEKCRCQCAPSHYTFREDMRQCIKDVGECPVAMFVRPFAVERIPLVFLPMTGQLVYPGAHLTVSGIARLAQSKHLTCNVKASLLMTAHGWQPIRTSSQIFGVYYDGNKTFLQWLGDDEDRRGLQHHLVLIRLQCEGETNNGTFEPCAALRIGWAPGLEPEYAEQITSKNNFIIIGLCLGILGLIYVGAVLIYMKVRKNRRRASRQSSSPQNTVESIEVSCEELRNTYINNLVQEAEFTTKSSKSGSNHSAVTENGIKTLDVTHRKSETLGGNHKSNGQSSHLENQIRSSPDAPNPEEITQTAQPPPQEFFVRIRGMIAAAKNRLNNFRYRPTLLVIPEDDYFYQDFKEKDIEGSRKSTYKKFSKKGNSTALTKMESFHGSNLGAAMLEAKLAAPLPPPRNTKKVSKKRAPSPPGERLSLPEYTRETPSPASLKELGGSLDRKTSRKRSPVAAENYSKFDLFRLDLYEKINRMREGGTESDIVLEYSESKRPNNDDVFDGESKNDPHADGDSNDSSATVQYAAVHQDSKISRRQLLYKLQEAESQSFPEQSLTSKLPEKELQQTTAKNDNDMEKEEEEDEEEESGSLSSQADTTDEDTEVKTVSALPTYSSRPGTAMSNSSARTTSSQPSTMKENKPALKESIKAEKFEDNISVCSETSEASLSGDSLNSSFRRPEKSPSALKIKKCLRSTEDLSVISGSSVITSSTAIKEIDDYDDDDEIDDMTQDDDSRLSTDLDAEMYSLDESEHPSLEEYLQLSSQVAKKLSERTVPAFNNESPKEKNVISQFMKEFKTTIGRLKPAEDGKPKTSRNTSPGSDNWTLKREEKRAKVSRRVSIFKRNPLKGRKNEEPLVNDESDKSGYFDNNAVETDDAESSRSSTSSMSGKKGRQRYKVKTPEIVPATKVVDIGEKTVIAITNEPKQNGAMEIRQNARYTPSPVSPSGMPRVGKAVTPPLPPPKPHIDEKKLKKIKTTKKHETSEKDKNKKNSVINQSNETVENSNTISAIKNVSNKNGKAPPRYVRTPSIESDSISVANSDMTEDSLNAPVPEGESEAENLEDISEDENGPIDRCLAQLADSVIQPTDDCSLNRYLSQLGTVLAAREDFPSEQCINKIANNINANRATKGFNLSLHLPLCTWEHVCVDKGSDRSTPTSDRSSTSRGSHGSQENLRKKTLTKSKHHHHHHRSSECKHSIDDIQLNSLEKLHHFMNGHNHINGNDPFTAHIMAEHGGHRRILKGKSRIASTSEEDECGRASSLGSTRELETPISETTSDPGSADLERPRKKRPLLRKSKKGLNGTCKQHIQNSKFNKKENGSLRKGGFHNRNLSTPRSSSSDVTVIQLEGDSHEHVTNVESSTTFVTLINVDSSDCSNSAEEK